MPKKTPETMCFIVASIGFWLLISRCINYYDHFFVKALHKPLFVTYIFFAFSLFLTVVITGRQNRKPTVLGMCLSIPSVYLSFWPLS